MKRDFVVAVDVGTASARAGIVDRQGRLLARAEHPIVMNVPRADHAEHDSEDIWAAVCQAVRTARAAAGVEADEVAGIGFDATCSIVVRGTSGEQVTVSTTGEARFDTIVWLDHRAIDEADQCTATGHEVVDYAGGAISPEMATPKLAWLKRNLPQSWARAALFLDLADFLTWKAAGATARSQCTLTCKWTFLAHRDPPWSMDYLAAIGIADMLERGSLPAVAAPVGSDLGPLTPEAARALGLTTACRVAAGLIDAHAGALSAIGGYAGAPDELDRRVALVAGTSSCVTAMTREPRKIRGVWGPYLGAALPDLWLSEGGQSVSGGLLDHIIRIHGGGLKPDRATHERICARIGELRSADGSHLAALLHVVPDFHGNRSPLGDPHAAGVVSGLTLDASFDGLCRLYWRTAVAIALGIRQIVEALNGEGHAVDTLHVVGGHTRNPVLMQLYADATGCDVVAPAVDDAMLLGTAMAAAFAAGWHPSLLEACGALHQEGVLRRADETFRAHYDHDYRVLKLMQAQRAEIVRLSRSGT